MKHCRVVAVRPATTLRGDNLDAVDTGTVVAIVADPGKTEPGRGDPGKTEPDRSRPRPGLFHFTEKSEADVDLDTDPDGRRWTAVAWETRPGNNEIRLEGAAKTRRGNWTVVAPPGVDTAGKTVEIVDAVDGTVEGTVGTRAPGALNLVAAEGPDPDPGGPEGRPDWGGPDGGDSGGGRDRATFWDRVLGGIGIDTKTLPKLDGMGVAPFPYTGTRLVELARVAVGGSIVNIEKNGMPRTDIDWNPGWIQAWKRRAENVPRKSRRHGIEGKKNGGGTQDPDPPDEATPDPPDEATPDPDEATPDPDEATGLGPESAAVVRLRKMAAAAVAEIDTVAGAAGSGGAAGAAGPEPPLAVYAPDTVENRWALLKRTAAVGKTVRGDCEDLAILAVDAIEAAAAGAAGGAGAAPEIPGPDCGIAIVVVDPTEEKTRADVEEDRRAGGAVWGTRKYRNHMAVVAGRLTPGPVDGNLIMADATAGVADWKWAGVVVAIIPPKGPPLWAIEKVAASSSSSQREGRDPSKKAAKARLGITLGKNGIVARGTGAVLVEMNSGSRPP